MTQTRLIASLVVLGLTAACATSPLGRKQFIVMPDSQLNSMGVQAFQEMKAKTPTVSDPKLNAYIHCVVDPIVAAAKGQTPVDQWEVVIFKDDTANAFALPGGKIGVHTGLLPVAKTDSQLAAVLGHEVGHVIARHGNERVSEQFAAQGTLAIASVLASRKIEDQGKREMLFGLIGAGVAVGLTLPHSRTQESEADLIGLDLMSRAGFDPRESVSLWQNMMKASGGAPPEFLSTHPASQNRIQNLQAHMAEAMPKYEAAKAAGHAPICQRP